jgi:hypothetical protein
MNAESSVDPSSTAISSPTEGWARTARKDASNVEDSLKTAITTETAACSESIFIGFQPALAGIFRETKNGPGACYGIVAKLRLDFATANKNLRVVRHPSAPILKH